VIVTARLLRLGLLAGLALWDGTGAHPLAAAEPRTLSFSKLNRSYENLVGDLQPITQGPLTVELSTPSHTLVLKSNRLVLAPLASGAAQQAHLELEIMGKGLLVADVEGAGLRTRLQDELFVPPQTVTLDGRIELRRAAGGYEVTPVELPKQVDIKIQSKLSTVSRCSPASTAPPWSVPCRWPRCRCRRRAAPTCFPTPT
jgi:hypothetical protein